ncbi:SGNH/GDSL hydrolase family protein [Thiococcus pfennigii]|uniref:SGNH/GDSL hydrolase family protein n=1 Tax=Thiococcus pfennigii TaxID=1057 RepID=UPI001904F798|nr:SGNH/GDSL hydrolase family protein [Thiococcus pfennigii]MBK1732684.1 hypothetical protein [Thiococcus pfennigii]
MSDIPNPNPELMVIGDSLAQGCRTLSVSDELCAQSYACLIARAQGWAFRHPRLPRPVLFDLEREIRDLSLLGVAGGLRRLRDNLAGWRQDLAGRGPGDLPAAFDNLAIAGVTIDEMNDLTAGEARTRLQDELFPKMIGQPIRELFPFVDEAHLAINTAFVLNPTGAPEWAGLTQLGWVERRRPRRLIAHFGHNDGLYPVGADADTRPFDTRYDATLAAYEATLDRLAALPPEVTLIVIVLYPKIGAVANLDPHGPRDHHGYAETYRTRFPLPGKELTGRELRRIDQRIADFNRAVRWHIAGLADARRFRIVDAYRILDAYDYKNTYDARRQIAIGDTRIDNRYLTGRMRRVGRPGGPRPPRYEFDHGGLQSLDGMHLSAVGYAVLACEIMDTLGLDYDRAKILARALRDEDLISRYNGNIHRLGYLLDTIEDLRPTEQGDEELSFSTMLGVQGAVFRRDA